MSAILENCLPKVSAAAPLPTEGLVPGDGRVHRSPDATVVVVDSEGDFACQVVATADPEPVSEGLGAWAEGAGYALIGRVPMTLENQYGLYLYGRAEAGGYVQIHLTNLPDGRLGALLTRAEENQEAERALR